MPTARGTTNISDLYYGEFDGEGDYIPELFIGRLPVSDTTQLKGMVKKIIDYETFNYQGDNDFWSGALATAGNAPGFELYMNGQIQYIYNNYLSQ
ncbi:MAG: C25 family cysteine peptidase [Marinilabiliales bacterium]|nr:C25 family cysteine peptidase [Marinilabiliales bacterium]